VALTVLSVGYPLAPVRPDAVGGTEQVLGMLDRALVEAGHRSVVVASAGSRVAGELLAAPTIETRDAAELWSGPHAAYRQLLRRAVDEVQPDVVHLHGVDFHAYLPEPGPPVLVTLHLPAAFYPPAALSLDRPATAFNSVSASARAASLIPDRLCVVPNGVRLDTFRPAGLKADFVLALGRICPEKGFEAALDAAHAAGLSLILAGQVFPYPEHEAYYAREIQPRLDARRRFVGPAGQAERLALLARAQCVVIPSRVAETSSLVAMEAMASGTPVVARACGALPEIVEHGRTGLLFERDEEIAAALREVRRIDPIECRRVAERRFSAGRMFAGYERLYASLVQRRTPCTGRSLNVEVATGLEALHTMDGPWQALWDRAPSPSAFQHPAWLVPWARTIGRSGTPIALLVRRGRDLVGLAPLWRHEHEGRRWVRWLGVGTSDELDVLAAREDADDVARAVLDALPALEVDAIDLGALPDGSPLLPVAGAAGLHREPAGVHPVLELPATEGDLASCVSRRRLANLAYARRRLQRTARLSVERATAASLESDLQALFRLHTARWSDRGEPGVLADDDVQAFHRAAARGLLDRGWLQLYVLRVNGSTVAAYYGWQARGRAVYYIGGFDPEWSSLSPGGQLVEHALREAVREGARELDLLRGGEPYKYGWGARDRPLWRVGGGSRSARVQP
jgi:CelD/BcsL family acetyltransferase involved in cellulose biosynthesis/glycosyltransferase involved in cell wall biosynthesis